MIWTCEDFDINDYEGFVYLITSQRGRLYIGKKNFWQYRTPKGGKKKVKSESNWQNYYSSSIELKADVKKFGKDFFKREILHLCESKMQMTYLETNEQFVRNVIGDERYYNKNILGKFYQSWEIKRI